MDIRPEALAAGPLFPVAGGAYGVPAAEGVAQFASFAATSFQQAQTDDDARAARGALLHLPRSTRWSA